jgi:hypothetical protein
MSLGSMRQELLGIPGTNFGLTTTKINEALTAIQNENVWSFQQQVGGWLTPGLLGGPNTSLLSPGLITVVPFTTTITGDWLASMTWQGFNTGTGQGGTGYGQGGYGQGGYGGGGGAVTPPGLGYTPLLTTQQIRIPYYSLYNIIALGHNDTCSFVSIISAGWAQKPGVYFFPITDAAGPGTGGIASITVGPDGLVTEQPIVISAGFGYVTPVLNFMTNIPLETPAVFFVGLQSVLTLDRPWMEPNQVNSGYMIYQAYFPAPPGFKRWYYILDTTNNNWINWWSYTQVNLSEEDSERINFLQPTNVIFYGPDTRPGSATLGQMLYELWPHPIMQLPYTFGCQANWPALQAPSDTVPYPLTDELVKMRAYEMLYIWKESQKGNEMERGSGANWLFLMQAMRTEYDDRLKRIRIMDRHLVDLYFTKMRRMPNSQQVWGTVTGQANVGGWNS